MSDTLVIPDSYCSHCKKNTPRYSGASWCRDCHNKNNRKYYKKFSPEKQREKSLKAKYGITYSQFLDMLNQQNGCCAICLEKVNIHSPPSDPKKACVDHDHKEGERIRGILCSNCNRALGLLYDDLKRIKRIEEYLKCQKPI